MAAFTPGNIIVYEISGTTSAAAAASLVEYNATTGAVVQTIPFPTTTTGTQDELTDTGQATYSGEITESSLGSILAAGYDAPVATAGVSGTSVPRVVGVVSPTGTVDTSTTTTSFPATRFTSAASADNQNFYVASGNGIGYVSLGANPPTTTTTTALTTTAANEVLISNGQLYYSAPVAGTNVAGIYALGTGLPTSGSPTSTLIATSTKPAAFAFASLSSTNDTLYVADNTNGIEKYTLGTGTPPYTLTGTVSMSGAVGLSVTVTAGVATLYVTSNPTVNGTITGTISKLVDATGVGGTLAGTPTTFATTPGSVLKGDVVYQTAACFATGTAIRTDRGDVAVEDLRVGDLVVTSSGARRPVRWLGHRKVDCRRHPRPSEVMPVRISAHAFGENRPSRDLYVSPGHSVCVDVLGEVLIPASSLRNGATVQQIDVEHVTYWHVELHSHDVILSENLPSESYLEMGNRGFFSERAVVALAAGPDADAAQHSLADFCRPFHVAGPIVEAVKARLRRRTADLGWALEETLDLHLEADGRRLAPVVRGLTARFQVPADACDVWLVSPTARPCDTIGVADERELGISVAALRIEDGLAAPRTIAMDDPLLDAGFHEVEDKWHRWTAGRARLPAALWEGCEDGFYLCIDFSGKPMPRWQSPEDEQRSLGSIAA